MKLLMLILAGYVGYRTLRSWNRKRPLQRGEGAGGSDRRVDDIMVQDPVCKVYFPKKEGIRMHTDDKEYFFCSPACRDAFLKDRQGV